MRCCAVRCYFSQVIGEKKKKRKREKGREGFVGLGLRVGDWGVGDFGYLLARWDEMGGNGMRGGGG